MRKYVAPGHAIRKGGRILNGGFIFCPFPAGRGSIGRGVHFLISQGERRNLTLGYVYFKYSGNT